jgi:hypothetical protein
MRLEASFALSQELSRAVFMPIHMDDFDGFCLKEHMKGNGGILAGKYPR